MATLPKELSAWTPEHTEMFLRDGWKIVSRGIQNELERQIVGTSTFTEVKYL